MPHVEIGHVPNEDLITVDGVQKRFTDLTPEDVAWLESHPAKPETDRDFLARLGSMVHTKILRS